MEFSPKELNRLFNPAKPAALWKSRRQLAKRQRKEQRELNHLYTEVWKVWHITEEQLLFGDFDFDGNKGLSMKYGFQLLLTRRKPDVAIENKRVWKEMKNEVLPALEEYVKKQLEGAA